MITLRAGSGMEVATQGGMDKQALYWNYAMQVRCEQHKTGSGWQRVTDKTAPGNILSCDKCRRGPTLREIEGRRDG